MLKPNSNNHKSLLQDHIHPDFLSSFYHSSIINRLPIVVWRLPGKDDLQSIIDLSGTCSKITIDLENIPTGFIISPFVNKTDESAILIKAHLHLKDSKYAYMAEPDEKNYSQITQNKLLFENTLEKLLNAENSDTIKYDPHHKLKWYPKESTISANPQVSEKAFCLWVEKAKQRINENFLKKVVLSRTIEVKLRSDFNAFNLFDTLCAVYPDAFVSLVALPGIGTWIGASPELLLSINNNQISTEALAGTQSVSSMSDLSLIEWKEKERKEQAIVSEFTKNCFLQCNVTNFTEHGPKTVQAGNLLHLQTKFNVTLPQEKYWETVNHILLDLHPTPAVCGFPKKEALDFILDHETHDREFYAGFLGPVNLHGQSQLYVNLRCMQLKMDTAILYAGAGIMNDSEPEKEWLETELKLNTLRNYLSSNLTRIQSDILDLVKNSELDRVL